MKYACKTDIGQRLRNEDSYYIPSDDDLALISVADGMGGHNAGMIASALAVEEIAVSLRKGGMAPPGALLEGALRYANSVIFRYAADNAGCRGMGTTITSALLFKNRYYAANVGDSRLYHFDGESLVQITRDHSYVAVLVASGEITREEASCHPKRNIITRALGTRVSEQIDIYECEWKHNDLLLLCTDGMHAAVDDKRMTEVIKESRRLDDACDALVSLALKNGATDNITVVLAQNA